MMPEHIETIAFTPAVEQVISDLESLKVLADPLRLRILELLRKPGTVKRVAEKLGKPPTKLYYHFNLLEKHGLIQMVETRLVSGIVEKHYQVAARSFRIQRDLLSPGSETFDEGLEVTLKGIFSDAHNDLREALVSGVVRTEEDAPKHRRLRISKGRLNLTTERAGEFYQRLHDLIDEFTAGDDKNEPPPGTQPYTMLLLLHPSSRKQDDQEAE